MNKKTAILILSFVFLLVGCGNQPELTKEELANKLKSNNIFIVPIEKPITLSERTKGKVVLNSLIGVVVSSVALGGGSGTTNINQMQKESQIAMDLGRNVTESLPNAIITKQGGGIDTIITNKLTELLKKRSIIQTQSDAIQLLVNVPLWEIGFKNMFSDYNLNYHIFASLSEKNNKNEYVIIKKSSCAGTYDKSLPLDDWRKDDYKEVTDATKIISEKCFEQIVADFEL